VGGGERKVGGLFSFPKRGWRGVEWSGVEWRRREESVMFGMENCLAE